MAIQAGSKVKYKAAFLRSIGAYTGPLGQAKGTVTAVEKHGSMVLAVIDWRSEEIPARVNVHNLHECGKPDYSGM